MPQPFKKPEITFQPCGDHLAVNLADLDRVDPFVRQAMGLAAKLDASAPICIDRDRWDETAVAFACDLLTAACLLDVIRDHDRKVKVNPTRVYVNRGQGWVKLPGSALLTLAAGGRQRLNHEWFGVAAEHAAAPLAPEKVF